MDPYNLHRAVAEKNAKLAQDGIASRFSVEPFPDGNHLWVWHIDSSGARISSTQVSFTIVPPMVRVVAFHPKFRWGLGEDDQRFDLRLLELLQAIFDEDRGVQQPTSAAATLVGERSAP